MHYRVDIIRAENFVQQCLITGVSGDKITCCHGRFKTGRQIIEGQDVFARLSELSHDVTSNITGSASDEYLIVFNQFLSLIQNIKEIV